MKNGVPSLFMHVITKSTYYFRDRHFQLIGNAGFLFKILLKTGHFKIKWGPIKLNMIFVGIFFSKLLTSRAVLSPLLALVNSWGMPCSRQIMGR